MRVAATNQLTALLDAHWPGATSDLRRRRVADRAGVPDPLPDPAAAAHLGEKRLAAFCVKHGYSGRRPAAELLTRLRSAPAGTTDATLDRRRPRRRAGPGRRAARARPRPRRTSTGPWSPTSGSTRTPRSSRRCQGRVRSTPPRCSPSGAIPAQPTTPPTPSPRSPASARSPRQSGKHRAVHFRWACNKRFRNAITTLRRQQPTRQPLGRAGLRRRHRPRPRPPARRPGPGPRLDPRHLPLLERQRPLRPEQTRQRRQTPRDRRRSLNNISAGVLVAELVSRSDHRAPRDPAGQAPACPRFLPQGPQRLRGQGRPQAVAQRSRQRPLRSEGRTRSVRGAKGDHTPAQLERLTQGVS